MTFARFCNLKAPRAKRIIGDVALAVGAWPKLAREAGIDDTGTEAVKRCFRMPHP